ncbi:MAG: hypothetical protein ACKO37_01150 [Vampirovibrionales bacterium]
MTLVTSAVSDVTPLLSQVYHVMYTHTDYSDVWPAYFGQTERFAQCLKHHMICVNQQDSRIPSAYTPLLYDDTKAYPTRLMECLSTLPSEAIILFTHEDMFLYDFPDVAKLEVYLQAMHREEGWWMTKRPLFDYIKLIKGGDCISTPMPFESTLHKLSLNSAWMFSIQPTFWRVGSFLKLLQHHATDTIWTFEEKAQVTCRKLRLQGGYAHDQGVQRGIHHWDNAIYPYIATAIVKGKWNTLEYRETLIPILEHYGISLEPRGEFTALVPL